MPNKYFENTMNFTLLESVWHDITTNTRQLFGALIQIDHNVSNLNGILSKYLFH